MKFYFLVALIGLMVFSFEGVAGKSPKIEKSSSDSQDENHKAPHVNFKPPLPLKRAATLVLQNTRSFHSLPGLVNQGRIGGASPQIHQVKFMKSDGINNGVGNLKCTRGTTFYDATTSSLYNPSPPSLDSQEPEEGKNTPVSSLSTTEEQEGDNP